MNVCVYTALFGDYTTLKRPQALGSGQVPLICFTESARTALSGAAWKIVPVRSVFAHPRLDAKYYRLAPEVALPTYDVTVWADASFALSNLDAFVAHGLALLPKGGMALYRHPERADIYSEAGASKNIWSAKYASEPLEEQVEHYRRCGMPAQHDLWATGILFRDNRSPLVRELNQRWLHECIRWSYQDQLSLPFVLWLMAQEGKKVPVIEIPGNIYQGPEHHWTGGADR